MHGAADCRKLCTIRRQFCSQKQFLVDRLISAKDLDGRAGVDCAVPIRPELQISRGDRGARFRRALQVFYFS